MEKGHTIDEFKPDSGLDVPTQPPVIGGVTQSVAWSQTWRLLTKYC